MPAFAIPNIIIHFMSLSYRSVFKTVAHAKPMSSFAMQHPPLQETDAFLSRVYTASPRNVFSLAVTGGGTAIIADLFAVPGASNSLMNACVPYSRASLSEFLGSTEKQGCSKETAALMAKAAFQQTVTQLLIDSNGQFDILAEANVFGVGSTAALVSNRPRRGLHRCHVATYSSGRVLTWEVFFRKGLRTRREEDYACSRLIMDALAATCHTPSPSLAHPYLSPESRRDGEGEGEEDEDNPGVTVETVTTEETFFVDTVFPKLLSAQTGMLLFVRQSEPDQHSCDREERVRRGEEACAGFTVLEDVSLPLGTFVYPGSFNPLHAGHIALVAAAMQLRIRGEEEGRSVVFEISALNADKPPLSQEEILRRVRQFARGTPMDLALRAAGLTNVAVCVTSRPYFEGKAALFRGCQFVVGADTLARLFLPKYYDGSRDNMVASVSHITQGLDCTFVVGGRRDSSEPSGFCDLASILQSVELPQCVQRRLFGLTHDQFRMDISSTDIRNSLSTKEAVL